jgi:hydrogenase nickel incorporation protein HypA/HybF
MHHVHPEAFEQSFMMAAMGGVAQNATAALILIPVRVHCGECGADTEADEALYACSACGSMDVEIVAGDELTLESIEYVAVATGG